MVVSSVAQASGKRQAEERAVKVEGRQWVAVRDDRLYSEHA